jgi:hypothetical protein
MIGTIVTVTLETTNISVIILNRSSPSRHTTLYSYVDFELDMEVEISTLIKR